MTLKDALIASKLSGDNGGGGGGMKAPIMIQCNNGGFEKSYDPVTEEREYYTYSELMALYEQTGGQLIGHWNATSYWPFEPMSPIYNDEGDLKWRCLFFDSILPGASGHIILHAIDMLLPDTDELEYQQNRYELTASITAEA